MVKDIYSGISSSYPNYLTAVGNTIYFAADNGINGLELWKSDGTDVGTVMVKDINSEGTYDSYPYGLTAVGNTLYFRADDGTNGSELWKSDGSSVGTLIVKDINPGAVGSSPMELISFDDDLYFMANDGNNGYELWRSDGTASGTVMVKDTYSAISNTNEYFGSYYIEYFHLSVHDDTLYFVANDGTNGFELWKYSL